MTLSAAQIAKLQKVFDGFDEAGSGHLQFDEFGKLMSTLGCSLTLEKLQEHIARQAIDYPDRKPDDAEHISFEFFCYMIAEKQEAPQVQQVQHVLRDPSQWWSTVPFGFSWPPSTNDDHFFVTKFVKTQCSSSNEQQRNKACQEIDQMYEKDAQREEVEDFLINKVFSPYPGLHLFNWESEQLGDDAAAAVLTRRDAEQVHRYLSSWCKPLSLSVLKKESDNEIMNFKRGAVETFCLEQKLVNAARLALLPAADNNAGNRANPITRDEAIEVMRAVVGGGATSESIPFLTGTIFGLTGFRWPAGRGANDSLVDARDWHYIMEEYLPEQMTAAEEAGKSNVSPVTANAAEINEAVRWAMEGMIVASQSSQSSSSSSSSSSVTRNDVYVVLKSIASKEKEVSIQTIYNAVPKPFQPACLPVALGWTNKNLIQQNLVDLDDEDRQKISSLLDIDNDHVAAKWQNRFQQRETRVGTSDVANMGCYEAGTLWNQGSLVQSALRTVLSTQCQTRAHACAVLRSLVLFETEKNIQLSVPPLTMGDFSFRWEVPGLGIDLATIRMREEAIQFLEEHDVNHPTTAEEHLAAAREAITSEKCATRDDVENVVRAWCEGHAPAVIRRSATSAFEWCSESSEGGDKMLDDEDRMWMSNKIDELVCAVGAKQEQVDAAKETLEHCFLRNHAEMVLTSTMRLESTEAIRMAACAVSAVKNFKWPSPGMRTTEMSDDDRNAAIKYIRNLQRENDEEDCLRAVSGCTYRGEVVMILSAISRGGNGGPAFGEELMSLSPGSGGVPNFFWPTIGMPRDPLLPADKRFARGFASALAEVALLGDFGGSFEDERISTSASQLAISRCASRRQVENVIGAMVDDGNEEAVVAVMWMGKWMHSKINLPTEEELEAAKVAKEKYRNTSLWRKAASGADELRQLTEVEINLSAAVAIDVAAQILGLTVDQSSVARRAVLNAKDDMHRASVLEACLEPASGIKGSMKSTRTEYDAARLKALLQQSNLPISVVNAATKNITPQFGKSEIGRSQHLIDTFLSVTDVGLQATGGGEGGGGGGGGGGTTAHTTLVDRNHRSEYESIINDVPTFDEKRKKAVLSAVHMCDTYMQLTEVFASTIRGEGNKTVKRSVRKAARWGEGEMGEEDSTKDGASVNRAHLSHIKDTLRTSYMFEGTYGEKHRSVQFKLEKAETYFELATIELELIRHYSDTVKEMSDKRKGHGSLQYTTHYAPSPSLSPPPFSGDNDNGSATNTQAGLADERKQMFATTLAKCDELFARMSRTDVKDDVIRAFQKVLTIEQALIFVIAVLASAPNLSNAAYVANVNKILTGNDSPPGQKVTRREREAVRTIISLAKHKDPANTVPRALAEVDRASDRTTMFECVEVVLLSYQRTTEAATGSRREYGARKTSTQKKVQDQVHLEAMAEKHGGDLLAHINGLNTPTPTTAVLPPVLSMQEAMAEIKGVDLMVKRKKNRSAERPRGERSSDTRSGPKSKQYSSPRK